MPDMPHLRRVMVDNQIRTFDVTDRAVLAAFDSVPREAFMPAPLRPLAYTDRRLEIAGQSGVRALLPPLILARLIQALQPEAGETALDCFGACGYSAAILAAIGLKVTALEVDPGLTAAATAALAGRGVTIARAAPALSADSGPKELGGAFDLILINGASEREPAGFFPLLKEGGRLGILLRSGSAARATVFLKSGDVVAPRPAFDAQAPVLPGFSATPGFVF